MADTDWLKDHINEVVLPNLINDIHELTGIQLDDSINEFKVVATALDPEDESSEEYEITIHYGDVCLVDACFLVEEIEAGTLPLCLGPEELTESLIQGVLDQLRKNVVTQLREEFAQELSQHDFDPKLAHLLDIVPEVVDSASGLRSSGGYPPIALFFRHPDHDPDTFEVSTRIDPLAKSDWVHWKTLMPKIEEALRAIGEEPSGSSASRGGPPARGAGDEEEGGPTAEDLEDPEIGEIEAEGTEVEAAVEAAPEAEVEGVAVELEDEEEAEDESLEADDGETFSDDDEDGSKKGKGGGKKGKAGAKAAPEATKPPPKGTATKPPARPAAKESRPPPKKAPAPKKAEKPAKAAPARKKARG